MENQREFSLTGHKLMLPGGEISPHEPVWITSVASGQVLDGACNKRTVQLIDRESALLPKFTGVNWTFVPQKNGTWLIMNQRQEDFLLGGRQGRLRLFRQKQAISNAGAHWLIYKHKSSGRYLMRPQEEDWMSCADGALTLTRMDRPKEPPQFLWEIKRPETVWEIKRPETVSLLQRVRRKAGALKRRLLT